MLDRMRFRAIVVSLCFTNVAAAQAWDRIVVFGDSLSDTGNVFNATFGIAPSSSQYFNGRFSNGPLWVERLADSLGVARPTPSRTGGTNYAHGGTTTATGNTFFFPFFNFPNAGSQVSQFLSSNTPRADDLFVLWAGANDFFGGQTNVDTPVNNLAARITSLASAGVTNIVVPNLPRLGETPRYNTTANRATFNARSIDFNNALTARLDSLRSSLNLNIFEIDIETSFDQILQSPASFGFANATAAALDNGATLSNPGSFVFWDDEHPTAPAHALIGSAAFETVTQRRSLGGDWLTAANWDIGRTPDATSAVSLGTNPTTLSQSTSIRRLDLNAGELQLDLAATLAGPAVVLSESANLAGTISLDATFTPLPGTRFELMTFSTSTGTPTLVNATAFAGLWFEVNLSATSLAAVANATAGDADLDGDVGFTDLLTVARNFGAAGGFDWLGGDFSFDGRVDFNDLLAMARNYGSAIESDFTLARSIVPEPAVMIGLVVGTGLMLMRKRKISHAWHGETAGRVRRTST